VRKALRLAFLLMGFSFSTTQALMARELLVSFSGNELSIGLVLGSWLALEALGSGVLGRLAGRLRSGGPAYAVLQVALALVLPLSLYGAVTVRRMVGVIPGEGVGLVDILWSSLLVLAPLGLVDGAMFAFGCRAYGRLADAEAGSTSRVYVLEAVGGIGGGLAFTYLFIPYLQSVQIVLVLAALNLASAASILLVGLRADGNRRGRSTGSRRSLAGLGAVITLLFAGAFMLLLANGDRVQRWLVGRQWTPHRVVGYRNSIYGNLAVIQSQEQFTFFANGIPILTAPVPDTVLVEETAHLPLLFRDPPRKALVVGGGVGGLLHELLKYPVEQVDYAEPDPALIQIVGQFPTPLTQGELADPRVRVHHVDARLLVRRLSSQAPAQYDLLVASLPYPSTLQLNRLYTRDFFRAARSTLIDDGLLVVTSPGTLTYMSPAMRNLNASLYDGLARAFPYVHVIPGEVNLWLASPGLDLASVPVSVLEGRWQERHIPTFAVTVDHIRYKLRPDRLRWFWGSLQAGEPVKHNDDLHPSGLLYGLLYWSELFSPGLSGYLTGLSRLRLSHLIGPVLVLILLVGVIRTRRFRLATVGFVIGTTGFAGMTFDLVVIFAFQTLYGYVYQQIGLLITAFMAGLSLGGWWMARWLGSTEPSGRAPRAEPTQLSVRLSARDEAAGRGSAEVEAGSGRSRGSVALRPVLLKLEVAIVIYLAAFALALAFMHARAPGPAQFAWMRMALLGLNGVAGLLVGLEFPLANAICRPTTSGTGETAGILYAADLVGACLGAVVVSAALLPALGILETCALLVALKAGSLALAVTMPSRHWREPAP
jgi:spermidine synthase